MAWGGGRSPGGSARKGGPPWPSTSRPRRGGGPRGSDANTPFTPPPAGAPRPDLIIVSRSNNPDTEAKLRRAGANRVINPHGIGGRRMALLALRPLVVDVIDSVIHDPTIELFFEDIEVKAQSPLAG